MQLTIEQALQQGLAEHKAGKLQEAERTYRALLSSQPRHAYANYNLGLIAISVNQIEAALLLFKTALDENPNIEEFWISFIDGLVKNNQVPDAKRAIKKAQKKGFDAKKLQALILQPEINADTNVPPQEKLTRLLEHYNNRRYEDAEKLARSLSRQFPLDNFSWKILGAVLKKTDRTSEAVVVGERTIEIAPQDAEAHSNLGNTFQELGRLGEAEASYKQAIELKPDYAEAHTNLSITLQRLGRLDEALAGYKIAIALQPHAEAHNNLGNLLTELGRLDDAEASYKQAIALKPDLAEAHSNLGSTLKELGKLKEAEVSCRHAVVLKPDYAEAHNNLGSTLKELGRLDEAEAVYKHAIALKPDYAESYGNLGVLLRELGRLDDAEISCRQAIALKPDFAGAHCSLGNTLKELGRLDEAEAIFRQAISLKPDLALAHFRLGMVHFIKGNEDLALESIVKANDIEPLSKDYELLVRVMESRKCSKVDEAGSSIMTGIAALTRLVSNPLILNREVEPELIACLYEMNFDQLDKVKRPGLLAAGKTDARYGNGIVSPDFNLFQDTRSIIKKLAKDLTKIMTKALKSNVYIQDSFFNILSDGGGTIPHNHLSKLDKDSVFNLGKQKYSLVYYLSVGDQSCREPGILKLYDPEEDILPYKGMILIIPASRMHSAVYGGSTDRVMVGVNFYCL